MLHETHPGAGLVRTRPLAIPEPPKNSTTHGMQYLFQVFCKNSQGLIEIHDVRAQSESNVVYHMTRCGLTVLDVGQGVAIVPDREILSGRDELSAALGCSETCLSESYLGRGILKRGKSGELIITKTLLATAVTQHGLKI